MIQVYDWKEIGKRAAWTFAQAALAIVIAAGTDYVNVDTWKAAAIAGGAAVFSFLKNVGVQTKNAAKE